MQEEKEKLFNQADQQFIELKRENEELQKLVSEKTAELNRKNQELMIEACLERVRARAMAMQHSDELAELVSIVFRELTGLEFPVTSCIIWINNPATSTEELWVANAEINKSAFCQEAIP